ncbi:fibronectin type III domain-containing protein [Collimonas sp. PA-H2]|uniref:fibronectin type III domain-containing protein n=1 Tax=Collimonas sp. PA-H2 TaxID=1881062 RepID=UPI000BF94700
MTADSWGVTFSRTPIVKIVDISHHTITVIWSAPASNRPITDYQFAVRKGYPNGLKLPIDLLPSPGHPPPYRHEIHSLTSNTFYYIQVRGVDVDGDASHWSTQKVCKTL